MQVRFEAMLGELARLEHRFDDAVAHLTTAASTSQERGYLQTEAYQVSCLGRAQCQAGDYRSGASTLQHAVEKAEATGDVRMAALARVHLGRILRALGESDRARVALEHSQTWHDAAGGGEQAILGRCLLAALDLREGVPDALARLNAALADAREANDAPSEVFALDALARAAVTSGDSNHAQQLVDEADRRMAASTHFIAELDRVDAPRFRHDRSRR
jgi:tetratricopeptide (TPR) repeat protein